MDRDSLELLLARGLSLDAIGHRFGKDPSTVTYWMKKYGLEAVHRERHVPRGALRREQLMVLVEAGLTVREIAARVDRGPSTVRYWLRHFGLRTSGTAGRRARSDAQRAKTAGLAEVEMRCPRHGETTFVLEGRGYYRCRRCRSEAVSRRRRAVKATLVREAGGRCQLCGYDRYVGALQFHHIDPAEKQFALSFQGVTLSLERFRAEAGKCALLCSNCHAELEGGMVTLSGI